MVSPARWQNVWFEHGTLVCGQHDLYRSASCAQARATPVTALVGGLRGSAAYAKGLWIRLNGGGGGGAGGHARMAATGAGQEPKTQLPVPVARRAERAAATAALSRSIDALEQKLQEASKVGSHSTGI